MFFLENQKPNPELHFPDTHFNLEHSNFYFWKIVTIEGKIKKENIYMMVIFMVIIAFLLNNF